MQNRGDFINRHQQQGRPCPHCDGERTFGVLNGVIGGTYYAGCGCRDCGGRWYEVYTQALDSTENYEWVVVDND